MVRFFSAHNTTALQKFVRPDGRTLAFDHRGIMETDEVGAAVVTANTLYGRTIFDGDETQRARPTGATRHTNTCAPRFCLRALKQQWLSYSTSSQARLGRCVR
jgi:hypothetical protein